MSPKSVTELLDSHHKPSKSSSRSLPASRSSVHDDLASPMRLLNLFAALPSSNDGFAARVSLLACAPSVTPAATCSQHLRRLCSVLPHRKQLASSVDVGVYPTWRVDYSPHHAPARAPHGNVSSVALAPSRYPEPRVPLLLTRDPEHSCLPTRCSFPYRFSR